MTAPLTYAGGTEHDDVTGGNGPDDMIGYFGADTLRGAGGADASTAPSPSYRTRIA